MSNEEFRNFLEQADYGKSIDELLEIHYRFSEAFVTYGGVNIKTADDLERYIDIYTNTLRTFLREISSIIKKYIEKYPSSVNECLDAFTKYHKMFIEKLSPDSMKSRNLE